MSQENVEIVRQSLRAPSTDATDAPGSRSVIEDCEVVTDRRLARSRT